MRGSRPFAEHNVRFSHVRASPCVYLVELSNGVVKVGYSRTARNRLIGLAGRVRAMFEAEIVRFHVSHTDTALLAYAAEREAIRRLHAVATPLPNRIEFFTGITFEAAVALIGPQLGTDG